jgi:hypothetical protein
VTHDPNRLPRYDVELKVRRSDDEVLQVGTASLSIGARRT